MSVKYMCPSCMENRSEFALIYKMCRRIKKDPESGEDIFRDEELKPDMNSGSSHGVVRCQKCQYTSFEEDFIYEGD